jgi:hypothetical protein
VTTLPINSVAAAVADLRELDQRIEQTEQLLQRLRAERQLFLSIVKLARSPSLSAAIDDHLDACDVRFQMLKRDAASRGYAFFIPDTPDTSGVDIIDQRNTEDESQPPVDYDFAQ